MSKLTNALLMLNILSVRSIVSLKELADILEISVRGVQRLRDELEVAGYVINSHPGLGGGYSLDHRAQLILQDFSLTERRHLRQALSILSASPNPSYGKDFVLTVAKLAAQLDDHGSLHVPSFHTVRLNVDALRYQKHLDVINHAIVNRNRVDITYNKTHDDEKRYVFEPYELVIVDQFWYVLGYEKQGRYLSLKVNRISAVQGRQETFLVDESTHHRKILSEFGYRIKPVDVIAVVSGLDTLSEYIWGENQQIEWLGPHQFQLSCTFPNELALKDFVLRGGRSIRVQSPDWLIEWIIQESQAMTALYR